MLKITVMSPRSTHAWPAVQEPFVGIWVYIWSRTSALALYHQFIMYNIISIPVVVVRASEAKAATKLSLSLSTGDPKAAYVGTWVPF